VTRWLVLLDDPDLPAGYRAEVEAETRKDALQQLADAAVKHAVEECGADPSSAAVVGAATEDAFTMYGVAVPLDDPELPVVDLTEEMV
jgi:hypothetical protein